MKFSIITPSFNQGRFIGDCIRSVQENAREVNGDVEHIVVDACSTDGTFAVLESHSHLRWTSEPDQGQTDAINKGFRRASGDWRMWLNADDYLRPGALTAVLQHAATHPSAQVIYGDCDFVREDGTLLREKREFAFNPSMLLFYGCYIPSTACFYHRQIFEDGMELDANFRVCMDFEWYLKLHHAGYRFAHLARSLAAFRWHETNVSKVQFERRREERLVLQRRYLGLQGRSWLGHEPILRFLFHYYRALRATYRALRRFS